MSQKFYIGLIAVVTVLMLIFLVAPYLRLRQREIKRKKLESWYELGPKLTCTEDAGIDHLVCSFCGNPNLKKELFGSFEKADHLKNFNYRSVDEARFYEYRCIKCGSLAFKEKTLIDSLPLS